MGFVNFLMTDEDKEKIYFPVASSSDGRRTTLWKWTVDEERNAFMVLAGIEGGPHADTDEEFRFVLVYKGFRIGFLAEKDSMQRKCTGRDIFWRVYGVGFPETVSRDEVQDLIVDALTVFGGLWDGEHYRVSVEFC